MTRAAPAEKVQGCSCQPDAELSPWHIHTFPARRWFRHTGTGSRRKRRELSQRRDAHGAETQLASGAGIGCQPFEILRRIPKRDTAISGAMVVSAFVTLARVAEKKGAWAHQF